MRTRPHQHGHQRRFFLDYFAFSARLTLFRRQPRDLVTHAFGQPLRLGFLFAVGKAANGHGLALCGFARGHRALVRIGDGVRQ